jgi:Polysaccharide pyruvyl transferase
VSAARFGLLAYPGIANLGDTIQTLAARRYLPQVDHLIERERIDRDPGPGPLRTILNGWFMHDPRHWPPHPGIEPLLVSMHFVAPGISRLRRWAKSPQHRMLSGAGGDYLRRWGPVGARDSATLAALTAYDIPAYHSGCLTLTLERPPVARSDEVIACDLPAAALARLITLTQRPVVAVTHDGGKRLSHAEATQAAQALLERYAAAAAVVTTRIHAALPCLALGTPVLLLHDAAAPPRITDMLPLLHSCPTERFLRGDCPFDLAAPPPNPQAFRPLAAALEERCRRFIAAAPASA